VGFREDGGWGCDGVKMLCYCGLLGLDSGDGGD
jgi:hypothetical protein